MIGRILAVDPGVKRIGLAISDPSATIANPLMILKHVSQIIDAGVIAQIAEEKGVVTIVMGQVLEEDGEIGPAARHAHRFAEAIRSQTTIPVIFWDESLSTVTVKDMETAVGKKHKRTPRAIDDLAAVVILQDFLDHQAVI